MSMNYWEKCPHGLPAINCVYCTSAKTRNETIEECARVAEKRGAVMSRIVAAAIRTLKDKQP